MPDKDTALGEILIEFRRVGKAIQVNAIDPETAIEVSLVGDPKAGKEALKRAAVRKLAYVIVKCRRARHARVKPPPGGGMALICLDIARPLLGDRNLGFVVRAGRGLDW